MGDGGNFISALFCGILYPSTHCLIGLKAEANPLIRFANKDGWLTATSRIAFGRSMNSG